MKTFRSQAAQGDVLLMRVESIPKTAKRAEPQLGQHVVSHSETGHDHYLPAEHVTRYTTDDPMVCYLRIAGDGAPLIHARSFDTHETIHLRPGNYEVRRQREHTPKGWRMVAD